MIFNVKAYSQMVAFTRRPDITEELHPYLNYNKEAKYTDDGLLLFTQKSKAWWEGKCGHTYKSSLASRLSGSDCPACSKPPKQLLYGFNDLVSTTPDIIKRWNYKRNSALGVHPEDFFKGSNETVWWLGEDCQHEWQDPIQKQVIRLKNKTGCPLCSGGRRRTIAGVNDLLTTHPDLASELDVAKSGFDAKTVSAGSGKTAWWVCKNRHEINVSIKDRVKHYCVYCAGQKAVPGINDMATTHPELIARFHPTLNKDVNLEDIMTKTKKEMWWVCEAEGHEFLMSGEVYLRTHPGCPVCSNHRVEKGYNDMATIYPHLVAEWDHAANDKNPDEITGGSAYSASWKCSKGHETKSAVYNRALGKACRVCANQKFSSKQEKIIVSYLKEQLPDLEIVANSRTVIKGELDIYIPAKNLAVEFNGVYWHSEEMGKDRNYHYNKYKTCKDKGIQLIQIWEDDWLENSVFIKQALLHKLQETTEPKVGARKLTPSKLNYNEAAMFLSVNHIQGPSTGTKYYGLTSPGTGLRVVIVLKRNGNKGHEGEWLIERYATAGPTPGGFTKLLKHAEKEIKSAGETITAWVTFSDNCISDGGLYANNGFILDKELKPDYMYVVGSKRIHKFNYRLKRFREDPNLLWDENLSEKGLAQLNTIPRIWDAGKIRWLRAVN